jgi:hypothetical protein
MNQSLTAVYLIPYSDAVELVERLHLCHHHTHAEPANFLFYAFDNLAIATAFRLKFDAECVQEDGVLIFKAERNPEIAIWLNSCGADSQATECTALQFKNEAERKRFESGSVR